MPILNVETSGEFGIVDDLLPHQLPPNAWSAGKNIRFNDGKAVKFSGHEQFFDAGAAVTAGLGANWDGGLTEQVYHLLPVAEGTDYYWIFCGLKNVGVFNRATNTCEEITRTAGAGDYTATDANVDWTSCIIGGIPVINNGVDTPQMWVDPSFGPADKLTDLTSFSSFATRCGAMRVYKNYLIALDVTKAAGGGTRYPLLVKWSDSSALGGVPLSWDETDQTTDAGETELPGAKTDISTGVCLDCLTLRDSNIIYRDDSVWSMNFVGGTFVFAFRQIYASQGMLARRCMAEYEGRHFVVGQNDVFIHDGSNFESIIDVKRKDKLYSDIEPTYVDRTYVFANYPATEMWICYVQNGTSATWPNKAMVWNWRHKTWGVRDLPNKTAYITGGIVNTTVSTDIWSTPDGNWDTWTQEWGALGYSPASQSPCMATDGIVYKGDSTQQFAGVSMTSYVERSDIPLGEQDGFMRINAIYPRMSGSPVNITVGSQMAPGGAIKEQASVLFTPGTSQKVDARLTGTHAYIKISSSNAASWEMSGYDIEYDFISRR